MIAALIGFVPGIIGWYRAKQEAKLRLYEIAWEATKAITEFVVTHIRLIAKLVCVAIIVIYILMLRHEASSANQLFQKTATEKAAAEKALIDHVEADTAAAKARDAQNKLNAILAQKKTDADVANYQAELSAIKSKGKSNEIISQRAISNYRDGLRLAIERQESAEAARLLEDDTNQLASGNCDTALPEQLQKTKEQLATSKEAGAVCASDYNLCYKYVKTQQSILGVQNEAN